MLKNVYEGSVKLKPNIAIANMNPPLGEVTTDKGEGSVSTCELTEELMFVLLIVSNPLLEKRMRTMTIKPSDTKPPVAVVYYDSLLYLIN